jgi:hypothetical protein
VFASPITSPLSLPVAPLLRHGIEASGTVEDTRWAKNIAARVLMFSLGPSLVPWAAIPRVV